MKTPTELRAQAKKLRARAAKLQAQSDRAADNAPSSFVTGRSGRSRAQNRATDRALDLTIKNAKLYLECIAKATELERLAQDLEEGRPERRAREKEARKADAKRLNGLVAALPLVNDPDIAAFRITSAEWAKVHRDYRGIVVVGGKRVRIILSGGTSGYVFLTDKKVVKVK